MTEKTDKERDVLDKLGIREGMRLRLEGAIPTDLEERLSAREGVEIDRDGGDPVHVLLAALDEASATRATLAELRPAILLDGAIWILTPKKGQPGYLKQEALIPLARSVGLVDNKICSIDASTSAIRFVVPLAQREKRSHGPDGR